MFTAKYYQRICGGKIGELAQHLNKTQYWPQSRIREMQFEKLTRLIQHAYNHIPYYKKSFKNIGAEPQDIKSFEDYERLPILTKEIIKDNFDKMVSVCADRNRLIKNATGGSTGEPLVLYQDASFKLWADAARRRGWYDLAGCEYGDTCAVIWGASYEVKEDYSSYERVKDLLKTGEIFLNAFNLSPDRKMKFYNLCKTARPKLLRGYTSAVVDFARFLGEEKLEFPQVKGVILCAETVSEDTQKYVESVFNAPSYNTYGGRELSLIAMQCKCKSGLHEISENNYVEFESVSIEGLENAGNLIITNLNNYAMPFIRYRIGDVGVPGNQSACACGRGLPLISQVVGRTTEIFIFEDGTRINGIMFLHLLKELPVRDYQFIQNSPREIIFRYKRHQDTTEEVLNNIRKIYAKHLPDGVNLIMEPVDMIEKTKTGKYKFIHRNF